VVERLALDALVPYARNARTHSEAQVAQIAASIREFGFCNPCMIDGEGGIIAGHGRVMAARQLGLAEVPCIRLGHLTEVQRRAYVIADNKLALNAGWDEEMLALELSALRIDDFDLGLTGFDPGELDGLLDGLGLNVERTDGDTEPQIDRAEELRKQWGVETGQLWQLGEHRLLCGDSTNADDVARVMGAERSVVVVTDPPYSVNYEDSHLTRGGNELVHAHYHEANINHADLLCFLGILPCDLVIFSYSVNRHIGVLVDKLRQYKWEVRKELVWVKSNFAFWPGAAYQQKHEPIWICTRNGASFAGNVPSNEPTVFEFAKPSAHKPHPTMKPIELWQRLIGNHSNSGEIVFEPFCGSGTSIIACENLGRKCRAIEMAPAYVAVAMQRWADHTGQTPVLCD
jgi:DNA modification methylase